MVSFVNDFISECFYLRNLILIRDRIYSVLNETLKLAYSIFNLKPLGILLVLFYSVFLPYTYFPLGISEKCIYRWKWKGYLKELVKL
jgi:hypothetical protein